MELGVTEVELEITWDRATHVCWSFIWRLVIIDIAVIALCFIVTVAVEYVAGFDMTAFWTSPPVRLVLMYAAAILAMRLILGKNFHEFRLVLLSKQIQQTHQD